MKPGLLLTDRAAAIEKPVEENGFYLVVVNLRRYLKQASADASAAYFGDSIGTGLTRIKQFDVIAGLSPGEVEALIDARQSRAAIERWVDGNEVRLDELREVVAVGEPPEADEAPAPSVAKALEKLDDLGRPGIEELGALLSSATRESLAAFVHESGLVSEHLLQTIEFARHATAISKFEEMLSEDLKEDPWQKWFEENEWVLGSEFVRILDERPIDVGHIADYLMQAYDGFLDLVEIKRPEGGLKFWADGLDHGNYVPHSDLIKAITQATRYVLEVERESNNVKFLERLDNVKAIKPRCVLIFGRSDAWNANQREAYRVLNASYHSLTILTFDHVLDRARRILDVTGLAAPRDDEASDPAG
jgi:hypothetical protein